VVTQSSQAKKFPGHKQEIVIKFQALLGKAATLKLQKKDTEVQRANWFVAASSLDEILAPGIEGVAKAYARLVEAHKLLPRSLESAAALASG
jgi:hypothetical protein